MKAIYYLVGYAFGLLDRLLFLFSDCGRSYAVCGICFRLGIHFSAFDDSTASLFICVTIRVNRVINIILQLLYCRARLFVFVARYSDIVSLITAISAIYLLIPGFL